MRVSDAHRFLFVHIQKTGGSTIAALLDAEVPDLRRIDGLNRHAGLADILDAEPGLARYRIAAVVRNPWARMVSWWAMIQQASRGAGAGDELEQRRMRDNAWWEAAAPMDFETFVLEGTERWGRLRRSQVSYLTAGRRRADLVGRTETLDVDVAAIRAWLGLPPLDEVPVFNRSEHGDYREQYSDRSRARVAELFDRDIEAFGYTF